MTNKTRGIMDKAEENARGVLYIVGTPIGNLEDLTPRAARILREAELVAAEDTRRTGHLLQHVGSKAKMVSIHKFNERSRLDFFLNFMEGGGSIALVSDAGVPGISDPGALLVKSAREAGFDVRPVPGVSAVTAALSASGLNGDNFLFLGFLSSKREQRIRALEEVKGIPFTLVLFEAPHRIKELLKDLHKVLGDRQCFLARELTKLHETLLYGKLSEISQKMKGETRGEITLVIEGYREEKRADTGLPQEVDEIVSLLVEKARVSPKRCAELLAPLQIANKKAIYNRAAQLQHLAKKNRKEEEHSGG